MMILRNAKFQRWIFVTLLIPSQAFTSISTRHRRNNLKRISNGNSKRGVSSLSLQESVSKQAVEGQEEESLSSTNSLSPISERIKGLLDHGDVEAAIRLLQDSIDTQHDRLYSEKTYHAALTALASHNLPGACQLADDLCQTLASCGHYPSADIMNAIITVWAKSTEAEAGGICAGYIQSLWSKFGETGDELYVPMRSSYISTINALSRGRNQTGEEKAQKAEAMLEEMEMKRISHPRLAPNTVTINSVLNVWSKSRMWRGAARRSEQILERMIHLGKDRPELRPDTTSFNTVLDTLAKSREKDCEQRAEALLEKMEELSAGSSMFDCTPNELSFNIVINCWAQSRQRGSARRATAILRHISKRYSDGSTMVAPDSGAYTSTINAWARSRENDVVERAEEVLSWNEAAFKAGNTRAQPNALTYNSMINCYSKSKKAASSKALAILNMMKEQAAAGVEGCTPDVVTYTSVIDTLAKEQSAKAAELAIGLLEELEQLYSESDDDERFKPNIRTYTSTINAIGRSGKNPEKAEAILERLETMADQGNKAVTPDTVCYNAVLNAYGWSKLRGKGSKCFNILQRMIERSESSDSVQAKPDIITCNSVINACAFEKPESDLEKEQVIKVVVDTLEIFQKVVPKYGYPDHITYSQVIYAISNQMDPGDRQYDLAEATFWQCCEAGHVNPKVVTALEHVLPWSRFSNIMGPSLNSEEGERISFDLNSLPRSWTRKSIKNKGHTHSRPSHKRDRGYKVTNQALKRISAEKDQH